MDVANFRYPRSLGGRFVRLLPLAKSHAAALAHAARDPEVSRYLPTALPTSPDEMVKRILFRLDLALQGSRLPFAIALAPGVPVVGTTEFLRIDGPNDTVEVGGTWLDSAYWRTPVNTEAKYLMLRFAFETAGAHRVSLQTDVRDLRSRKAVERIGARPETVFREDVHLGEGVYRTSVHFGILAPEWPSVRARLETLLQREWVPPSGEGAASRPPTEVASRPSRLEPPSANPGCFRDLPKLVGRHVTLVPLRQGDVPELAHAGRDPEVWRLLRFKPATDEAAMAELVGMLLTERDRGVVQPFVIRLNRGARALGIVRFLDIDRANNQVELGTWIDSTHWRTPVNTEVKYLTLRHAFEGERMHRVQLRTDSRNERSKAAIERLGATNEGILREYILRPDGYRRSSICFSILEQEWPRVRAILEEKLLRPWDDAPPGAAT